ncbi:MAG TPA: Ig-like domain-containing protein [Planctomycetota bacterium]|nr:Ig-like domain-containing protein [Planctomycetota bacterium]
MIKPIPVMDPARVRWGFRALALGLLAALPACDNPACLYAPNGCQDGGGSGSGGGVGSQPASLPEDGVWILPSAPTLDQVQPVGSNVNPGAPVVLFFSESMNPATFSGALQILETSTGSQVPTIQPPPVVGDGRVVILAPALPLTEGGSYVVQLREGALLTDITGQPMIEGATSQLAQFTVTTNPDPVPTVLTTWPQDLSANQSDIGQIVTIFDRPMDPTTFNTASFRVTVNGLTPANNPNPLPLTVTTGPVTVDINSVWTWTSVDANGYRPSLGASGEVDVDYSQPPNKLRDEDGGELPPTILEYDIGAVPTAKWVDKAVLASPPDAIGRPNLLDVVPVIQVEVWNVLSPGDEVELYLFGRDPASSQFLRAKLRTHTVQANTFLAEVLPSELALLSGDATSDGVFTEGDLEVAVVVKSAGVRTTVRMADVDATVDGVQPFWFDVYAPRLRGLGTTTNTSTSSFTSDLRDLVIVGRTDEPVREVHVTTDVGADNLSSPEAIMAGQDGRQVGGGIPDPEFLFVAAPVAVGALDPRDAAIRYTVTVFDRALNPSDQTYSGLFRQVTGLGPGAGVPISGPVDVFVSDASTMAPLAGALVISHQVVGGVTTWVSSGVTDASGHAPVTSGIAGSETLISVDMGGYDLFTLHGLSRDVLGVSLTPNGWAEGTVAGDVTSPYPTVDLSFLTNQIADNRRSDSRSRFIPVNACTPQSNMGLFTCPYGPDFVAPHRVAAMSMISADFTLSPVTFNPVVFLRAIGLSLPLWPLEDGDIKPNADIHVENTLLNLGGESHAIGVGSIGVVDDLLLDLGALAGPPVVTMEGLSPGLHGSLTVGAGMTFDAGGGDYDLRAAYAGMADGIDDGAGDLLGELVTEGTIQADLLLRVELEGTGGRTGLRPRLSNLAAMGGVLLPPNVPVLVDPVPNGSTGGVSFALSACDRLPDSEGLGGMHRFVLTDQNGRRWVLWREDGSGGSSTDCSAGNQVTVQVPDIASAGGSGLASGPLTCRISTLAWKGFDPASGVLWSDLGREQEFFTHSGFIPLVLP